MGIRWVSRLGAVAGCLAVAVTAVACAPGKGQAQDTASAAACGQTINLGGAPLCPEARSAVAGVQKAGWSVEVAFHSPVAVYLPTWSPALLPGMCSSVSPSWGDFYYVEATSVSHCQQGISLGGTSGSATAANLNWLVAGGEPPYADQAPALAAVHGSGKGVNVGHGLMGALFAEADGAVLQWQSGGWTYQVAGQGADAAPGTLTAAARLITAAQGRGASPVPGVTSGYVLEPVASAAIWVSWTQGGTVYSLEGPDTSVFSLAASMVKVPMVAGA